MLALVKGGEQYVFFYPPSERGELLKTFGRFASDPTLSFSWYDAAALSQKVREEANGPVNQGMSDGRPTGRRA